jgi:hypothetical protein
MAGFAGDADAGRTVDGGRAAAGAVVAELVERLAAGTLRTSVSARGGQRHS